MNVLSLFDGMSCGQQALERQGIKVDNYFASEIDKYAIQVTMANYPNTKQLGSVIGVDARSLPKIDLLIGGSPCQSFSFSGKRKGMSTKDEQEIVTLEHYLQLRAEGFEFEGQSYLFWEYMRILNEIRETNPNVLFLLENVLMGSKWEKILTKAIGVAPIMINSSLVSAQNRPRLYWTNIGLNPIGLFGDLVSSIQQPTDKKALLVNVLEDKVDDKYYLSHEVNARFKFTDNKGNIVGTTRPDFRTIGQRDWVFGEYGKMSCLTATDYKQPKQVLQMKNQGPDQLKVRKLTPIECERLQTVKDNYTACVSDTQRYKMLGNGWTVDVIAHIFSYIS
jgi:DNA-cytosine methyltransferase